MLFFHYARCHRCLCGYNPPIRNVCQPFILTILLDFSPRQIFPSELKTKKCPDGAATPLSPAIFILVMLKRFLGRF